MEFRFRRKNPKYIYIEYWFEGFDTNLLSNARFTKIENLEDRLENENIIKLNIVRNGQRENIRG